VSLLFIKTFYAPCSPYIVLVQNTNDSLNVMGQTSLRALLSLLQKWKWQELTVT